MDKDLFSINIRDIPRRSDVIENCGLPTRISFIKDFLQSLGIQTIVDQYMPKLFNLYCVFNGESSKKILITAHWDVVNQGQDNCLDNTASLFNLMKLACKLKRLNNLNHTVVLAWTDSEEDCIPDINGAVHAACYFSPEFVMDLELTAGGTHIVLDQYGPESVYLDRFSSDEYFHSSMPYNNASVINATISGRDARCLTPAICLTLVDDQDLVLLKNSGYCSRWRKCHRPDDTFDRWFNEADTDRFVDKLIGVIKQMDEIC